MKKHVLKKNACSFSSFLKLAKDRGQTDDYLQGFQIQNVDSEVFI